MKTAIYSDVNQVKLVEKPIPEIAKDEALVKVSYSGICGTDLGILAGKHPRAKKFLTFGHEFIGQVAEIHNTNHNTIRVGDMVAVNPLLPCGRCFVCKRGYTHVCKNLRLIGIDSDGGMAEYAKVPLGNLVRVEEGSFHEEELALAEPIAVAVHAINQSEITEKNSTAIIGAGPIGLLIAYTLRFMGNKNISIADVNPGRLELASEIENINLINANEQDVVNKILLHNNGDEVDCVFEVSGSQNGIDCAIKAICPKGTIIQVGVHEEKRPIDLLAVLFEEITLKGVRVYTETDFMRAVGLIKTEHYNPRFVVTHIFCVEDIGKALDTIYSGGSVGKVLIKL